MRGIDKRRENLMATRHVEGGEREFERVPLQLRVTKQDRHDIDETMRALRLPQSVVVRMALRSGLSMIRSNAGSK